MKKIITLLCCLVYSYASMLTASVFTIGVPQKLLDQNSSLMVYMLDQLGHQYVGKCQLDSSSGLKKILQNDLELTTWQDAASFDTVVDLMDPQESVSQDVVVLHFEFDSSVRILRILVVKNSFLDENPFDVLTLSVAQNNELAQNHHMFDEFEDENDELSALVDNVDAQSMQESIQQQGNQASGLQQYVLYAEIYMLMQYGRVKRAMHNMTSWLSN